MCLEQICVENEQAAMNYKAIMPFHHPADFVTYKCEKLKSVFAVTAESQDTFYWPRDYWYLSIFTMHTSSNHNYLCTQSYLLLLF